MFSVFTNLHCLPARPESPKHQLPVAWKKKRPIELIISFDQKVLLDDVHEMRKRQLTALIMDSTSASLETSAERLIAVPPNSSICAPTTIRFSHAFV
jgi:hypothetical protein